MLLKLPHWCIVDKFPAFYDTESATAIEQTARIHAKVNELIESYNKYCEDINKAIEEYEAANDKDYSCFTKTVTKLIGDYIGMVDLKIIQQDRKLAENYKAFTDSMKETVKSIMDELKENGELDLLLLEAVDNLNSQFETFKNAVNKTVEDIAAGYDTAKKTLSADYAATKESLSADYAATKESLSADYAATKESLSADYAATKESLSADYEEVENEMKAKYKRYIHNITIYGVINTPSGQKLNIAFNFAMEKSADYELSVELAIKSCMQNVRFPINGFLTVDDTDEYNLFAAMYIERADNIPQAPCFWIFCLNSELGLPTYQVNGAPLNLLDYLDSLNIIDDMFDKGAI